VLLLGLMGIFLLMQLITLSFGEKNKRRTADEQKE
jgi:hypothetical protein